jgi:hypothetical protein
MAARLDNSTIGSIAFRESCRSPSAVSAVYKVTEPSLRAETSVAICGFAAMPHSGQSVLMTRKGR